MAKKRPNKRKHSAEDRAGRPSTRRPKPRFADRTLWVGPIIVKRFEGPADVQELILEAWPTRTRNSPISGGVSCRATATPRVETIIQRAREAYLGVTPRIITDNGPQFIAKDFKEFIRIAGMTHVKTSPYYPQSNGKIERWHKTLKGDCLRLKVPLSLDDARRIVADYVAHYNNVRLHSAIGYITPKNRLEGRHQQIADDRDGKLAQARQRRQQLRQAQHEQQQTQATVPPRPAIDFAAVRTAVTMAAVLGLLGFEPNTSRGGQQRGPCPLHGSTSGTSRCFSANLHQHSFHCFKCGRSGNALDLWAGATRQTIYDAALDLCQRLAIPLPTLQSSTGHREEDTVASSPATCTMESS
jgi:hypothetical protein